MAVPSSPNPKTPAWCWTINRTLLPLKLTLFFFAAAAFSILPYLTIHMKDIGISDIDIALIYTVLPFTVFLAPPLVGFLADRLGKLVDDLLFVNFEVLPEPAILFYCC